VEVLASIWAEHDDGADVAGSAAACLDTLESSEQLPVASVVALDGFVSFGEPPLGANAQLVRQGIDDDAAVLGQHPVAMSPSPITEGSGLDPGIVSEAVTVFDDRLRGKQAGFQLRWPEDIDLLLLEGGTAQNLHQFTVLVCVVGSQKQLHDFSLEKVIVCRSTLIPYISTQFCQL